MKKKFGLFLVGVMVLIPIEVLGHPGGLDNKGCHYCRTNCSKWGLKQDEYHCHKGNTYTNSKGDVYNKDGTKINNDSSSNNTTTENEDKTNTETPVEKPTNDNESTQEKPSNNNDTTTEDSMNNNPTTEKPSSDADSSNKKPVNNNVSGSTNTSSDKKLEIKPNDSDAIEDELKNTDVSLKTVKIDGKNINILDEMVYETNEEKVNLIIEPTDENAQVQFENSKLRIGENEILIKVIAESGNTKDYKIKITRKEKYVPVTIKKFVMGSTEIKFENNKGTIRKLTNESDFEYSYELSDKSAELILYVNDKEVKELNNIKKDDIIKLVVIDKNDNQTVYEIKVDEASKTESAIINGIAYTVVGGVLASPAIAVGSVVYLKKKKK